MTASPSCEDMESPLPLQSGPKDCRYGGWELYSKGIVVYTNYSLLGFLARKVLRKS